MDHTDYITSDTSQEDYFTQQDRIPVSIIIIIIMIIMIIIIHYICIGLFKDSKSLYNLQYKERLGWRV